MVRAFRARSAGRLRRHRTYVSAMSVRPIAAVLAAALAAVAGCARDEPRTALDPPTSTLEGTRSPSARAVFLVQNHEAARRRIALRVGRHRILGLTLPASDDESGHPSIHRFRYALSAGRYRLTVTVGQRTVTRLVSLPPRERRWVVVQNYDEALGLEVTVHRRRPVFG
jgi:hypothetical protein